MGCDVVSEASDAVNQLDTPDSASLLQVRIHEHENQKSPDASFGQDEKQGPSDVSLLHSDINNERELSNGFDESECTTWEWSRDTACELFSYNDYTYLDVWKYGRQHSQSLARECAKFCDHGKSNVKDNKFWISIGHAGDCRCCMEDGRASWTRGLWAWTTWQCVANPVNCRMNTWSDWGTCSKACGYGERSRSRTVASHARYGGAACGPSEESEQCKEKECPVDCTVSDWKPWSACSATCGTGTKTRSRDATVEAQHGGKDCDALEASETCKEKECPRHCTMSDWTSWGACSTTCGRGKRIRSRTVTAQAEHGATCEDAREASEECKEKECPVDCVMSEWKPWTECSATCGHATTFRTRAVISDPQHGGVACGETKEVNECPELVCPQEIFTVCGTVKAAQSNEAIESAVVKIDQPDSTCEKSSDSGKFCCENVKKGPVTVSVAHPDWTDYEGPFTIVEGSEINVKLVHDKKEGEWEFVLTWDDKPNDLDTHVTFGNCKVNYGTTKCEDGGVTASLDMDNRVKVTSAGTPEADKPETTTLTNGHKCTGDACHVWYRVRNYSKCKPSGSGISLADIKESKAKVDVWGYGQAKQTFVLDQGDG